MGTRADYYVGRGEDAEWLGSIGWDGYPDGIPKPLLEAATEKDFRDRLAAFFESRDDVTTPDQGWPWPWNDSQTTDYAYAFDGGMVWASSFGGVWFDPTMEQPDEDAEDPGGVTDEGTEVIFPNMEGRQNVKLGGKGSGRIVLGG